MVKYLRPAAGPHFHIHILHANLGSAWLKLGGDFVDCGRAIVNVCWKVGH
jgi:hypothetical protein